MELFQVISTSSLCDWVQNLIRCIVQSQTDDFIQIALELFVAGVDS